jgi:hypothetical protein
LSTGTNITLSSLTVGDGSVAVLGSGTGVFGMHSVMTVSNLNLHSTGVLDLNDNGLILTYSDPGSSPLSTIQSLIAAGQIKSSFVDANNGNNGISLGVGYVEAGDVTSTGQVWPWKGGPTLAGNPANGGNPTAILILPTILGDTFLTGRVDPAAVFQVVGSYPMGSGATWEMGDTDNNGTVDPADVFTVVGNYPSDMVSLGYWPSDAFDTSVGGLGSPVTVIPEPTTLALLALGGVVGLAGGAIRRRRHSSKAAA